ncbi:hypothetical protein [Chitinophaga sp. Cy-1792]|uniref:hypothetical protein n=1 Tax=Chitinophaga sp. Cy-1792 TaxID=2608339 RepID=UPI0014217D2F|nr:hypothetical protein [Chitinophaga sp. Cy-1792]NIG54547.1 hypothetical protein [Chitinophaga sp. Cy-1792]
MKILFLSLAIPLLLSGCRIPALLNPTQLQRSWPQELHVTKGDRYGANAYNNSQVAAGIIYLNGRDTISGLIKIVNYNEELLYTEKLPILKWGDIEDYKITKLDRDKVDSVRIFTDTVNHYPSTLFIKMEPKTLWRPIALSDNAGIYVPWFFISRTGKILTKIILYSEGKKHRIVNKLFYGDIKAKHYRHSLVRFMRRRFGVHKKIKDFQNIDDMFNFILQQEEISLANKKTTKSQ